jgi:hypothetical protein
VLQVSNPPFNISNGNACLPLGQNTAAMSVSHHDGALQYDTHNLYGLQVCTPMSNQETITIILQEKLLLTRSNPSNSRVSASNDRIHAGSSSKPPCSANCHQEAALHLDTVS